MFTLAIRGFDAGAGALTVTSFVGEEGISKLFKHDVDVIAPPGIDLTTEPGFLGRRAAFGIGAAAGAPEAGAARRARVVHGVGA